MDVFVHHQTHESRPFDMPVETLANEFFQRLVGGHPFEPDRGLGVPDPPVFSFEDRAVQSLFAAEIIIDHPLAGARPERNGINASAAQTLVRELLCCRVKDLSAGALGISGSASLGKGSRVRS
jgi:hypothetical protein